MIVKKYDVTAKKYAQAYLNLHNKVITVSYALSLNKLQEFLTENSKFLAYLSIPNLTLEIKEKILSDIFEKFNIEHTIKKLIHVLVEHRRIELFAEVIGHVLHEYKKRNNILTFTITSSHELNDTQKEKLVSFLEKKTKATIIPSFAIDEELISGIKIHGETLLFEDSLAKRLNQLALNYLKQVNA